MEQRSYVTIAGLPRPEDGMPDDEAWEPFIGSWEKHVPVAGRGLARCPLGDEFVVQVLACGVWLEGTCAGCEPCGVVDGGGGAGWAQRSVGGREGAQAARMRDGALVRALFCRHRRPGRRR